MKLSDGIRNARLNAIRDEIGPSPEIQILTDGLSVICSGTLPEKWLSAASRGEARKSGKWEISMSQGEGVPSKYRISGKGQEISGSLARMKLNSREIKKGQTVIVEDYVLTEGNA